MYRITSNRLMASDERGPNFMQGAFTSIADLLKAVYIEGIEFAAHFSPDDALVYAKRPGHVINGLAIERSAQSFEDYMAEMQALGDRIVEEWQADQAEVDMSDVPFSGPLDAIEQVPDMDEDTDEEEGPSMLEALEVVETTMVQTEAGYVMTRTTFGERNVSVLPRLQNFAGKS